MYIAHERHHPRPPPLTMDSPQGVDRKIPPYQPSSASSATVGLPSLPRSPQEPPSTSTVEAGRIYSLDVIQQPIRARMCGFGDKDRRPITPPPCIRLVVRDATTRAELDINEIDTSYYVLTVDLWSADGTREVNLVRHSANSPSISAATSASYPPPPPTPPPYYSTPLQQVQVAQNYGLPLQPQNMQQQQHMYQQAPTSYQNPYQQQVPQQYHQHQPLPPPPIQTQHAQNYYSTPTATPTAVTVSGSAYYPPQMQQQGPLLSPQQLPPSADPRSAPTGMFTRNLIGSLCVSAFKLTNPDGQMGVWFILQDLSVRTEGSFRLKMNFVNVGSPTAMISASQSQSLNSGSAPVLASCFSDVFQVFSAKKFPGVIESTALSKIFATQGIKIPIRKDGPRGNVREREDDDE